MVTFVAQKYHKMDGERYTRLSFRMKQRNMGGCVHCVVFGIPVQLMNRYWARTKIRLKLKGVFG